MITCRKNYVAARCCDVAGKSVQLEIVLAGKVLHLFADDLALDWQSAWRVHDYSESNCRRGAYFLESVDHFLGTAWKGGYSWGPMAP